VQTIHNLKELKALLAKQDANKVVVLDFTASWCGPCKQIAPVFAQLSMTSEFKDNVVFLKVDVDEAADVAQEYGISAMPTFCIWQNGTVRKTVRGANASALVQAIREFNKK
jgi:thioredoxin